MRESLQTGLSRGRRSRNKVSVGEPAEGSFQQQSKHKNFLHRVSTWGPCVTTRGLFGSASAGYGRSQNFGFGFVEVEFYT